MRVCQFRHARKCRGNDSTQYPDGRKMPGHFCAIIISTPRIDAQSRQTYAPRAVSADSIELSMLSSAALALPAEE